jgi:hypothetical protein
MKFIAPPLYHKHAEIWREIITESGYFFEQSSIRYFGSRIVWNSLIKLNQTDYLFITSEQDKSGQPYSRAYGGQRRYTVRKWNTAQGVNDLSEFCEFETLAAARKWATSAGWETPDKCTHAYLTEREAGGDYKCLNCGESVEGEGN